MIRPTFSASAPKVGISYSYDDSPHIEWVEKVAINLRKNGVDVVFDLWDASLGHDLDLFMENMVKESDFLLIIGTPEYARKADSRDGGVGIETTIIRHDAYRKEYDDKFIPLLRRGSKEKSFPAYLKGRRYLDWRNDAIGNDALEELLRKIHRSPKHKAPDIGPNPFEKDIGNIQIAFEDVDNSGVHQVTPSWTASASLWMPFTGQPLEIRFGGGDDMRTAQHVRLFAENELRASTRVLPAASPNSFPTTGGLVFIGGPLSNRFTKSVNLRWLGKLDAKRHPIILDQRTLTEYPSRRNDARYTEYAFIQCGTKNGLPAVYFWGSYSSGGLAIVKAATDKTGYGRILGGEAALYDTHISREWLYEVRMERKLPIGIKMIYKA